MQAHTHTTGWSKPRSRRKPLTVRLVSHPGKGVLDPRFESGQSTLIVVLTGPLATSSITNTKRQTICFHDRRKDYTSIFLMKLQYSCPVGHSHKLFPTHILLLHILSTCLALSSDLHHQPSGLWERRVRCKKQTFFFCLPTHI